MKKDNEVIKEMVTLDKKYKAVIMKRNDGLFEYGIYEWTREEIPEYGYISEWYWSSLKRTLSFVDSEDRATELAREELRLLSYEL